MHARGKPMSEDADLRAVARRTPGFTGADLANVLNEAALLTARLNKQQIDKNALDEAIDRVIAGPQRRTRLMSDKEKVLTAYHEGGHALVAAALPHSDPVHKVTILPRGRALGYTMVLPDEDKYSTTRSEMLDKLAYMLGGRAAEEMVFHDPTTGASNDIEKATALARAMVTQYGMTERLGAIKFGQDSGEPFLGRDLGSQRNYSEEIAAAVDEEVGKLILNAHQEAFDILVENRAVLDALVEELLEKETLDKAEIARVFAADPEARAAAGLDRVVDPGAVRAAAGDAAADPGRAERFAARTSSRVARSARTRRPRARTTAAARLRRRSDHRATRCPGSRADPGASLR